MKFSNKCHREDQISENDDSIGFGTRQHRVLVAGGSGVAMDVFRQLTAAGTWVTVLQDTRQQEKYDDDSHHFWIGLIPHLRHVKRDVSFHISKEEKKKKTFYD